MSGIFTFVIISWFMIELLFMLICSILDETCADVQLC